MSVTDTVKITEARGLLQKQYRKLKEIFGLYEQMERFCRTCGSGEELLQNSRRARELLEEELTCLSACISFTEEAETMIRRCERRITDRYNLDDIHYAHTEFGTSHFEQLAEFSDLIPMKRDSEKR